MLGLHYSCLLFSPLLFPPVLLDSAYRVPAPSFTWLSAFAQIPQSCIWEGGDMEREEIEQERIRRFERSLFPNTTLEINRRAKKTWFNKCANIYAWDSGVCWREEHLDLWFRLPGWDAGEKSAESEPFGICDQGTKNSKQVRCFVGETPQCSQFST